MVDAIGVVIKSGDRARVAHPGGKRLTERTVNVECRHRSVSTAQEAVRIEAAVEIDSGRDSRIVRIVRDGALARTDAGTRGIEDGEILRSLPGVRNRSPTRR